MEKFNYTMINGYENIGQREEQSVRYALLGAICKADNLHTSDVNYNGVSYQIKTKHATIGYGEDLHQCIVDEPSDGYIVALQGTGYIMTKEEFEKFASNFYCHDIDSRNGKAKIRLTRATQKMMDYLG